MKSQALKQTETLIFLVPAVFLAMVFILMVLQ